jgi:hypothetical protein
MGARVPRRPGRLAARPMGAIRPVGAEPRSGLLCFEGPGASRGAHDDASPHLRCRAAARGLQRRSGIRLPRSPHPGRRVRPSVRPSRPGSPLVAAGLRWPALSPIPTRARTSQGCQTLPWARRHALLLRRAAVQLPITGGGGGGGAAKRCWWGGTRRRRRLRRLRSPPPPPPPASQHPHPMQPMQSPPAPPSPRVSPPERASGKGSGAVFTHSHPQHLRSVAPRPERTAKLQHMIVSSIPTDLFFKRSNGRRAAS